MTAFDRLVLDAAAALQAQHIRTRHAALWYAALLQEQRERAQRELLEPRRPRRHRRHTQRRAAPHTR